MLPTTSSQSNSRPAPVTSDADSGNWPVVLACALILYTAGVGWGLLNGNIPSQRSFFLMALPCLLPFAWCAFGYFKGDEDKDQGLLLSSIGWLLILGALIIKDIAVIGTPTAPGAPLASSPLVPICAAFGVLCLLIGAGASWMFWASREERTAPQRQSTHY